MGFNVYIEENISKRENTAIKLFKMRHRERRKLKMVLADHL